MRTQQRLALTLILLAVAGTLPAQTAAPAQALTCGPSSAGSSAGCDSHHFHVSLYRFETRSWAEAWGVNGFATAAGCEAARVVEFRNSQTLAAFIRAKQPKSPIEILRVGSCHCDMSNDKTHPRFLDEVKRQRQVREVQVIRAEIREKLLDMDATPGSDVIRALVQPPSAFPGAVWSRQIPPPENPRGFVVDPTTMALKDTAIGKETARRESDTPFELAAIGAPPESVPSAGAHPAEPLPLPETKVEAEQAVAPPVDDAVAETPREAEQPQEESAADRFISYETSRITNILKASESISDDEVRRKIFESSLERSQVLENLRKIIDGAGTRSRLADLAQKALTQPNDYELVNRLFGPLIAKHWAPTDARDVVITFPSALSDDPVSVLRDTTGRFSLEERQTALYIALAREALTSRQESWLTGVVETLASQ